MIKFPGYGCENGVNSKLVNSVNVILRIPTCIWNSGTEKDKILGGPGQQI